MRRTLHTRSGVYEHRGCPQRSSRPPPARRRSPRESESAAGALPRITEAPSRSRSLSVEPVLPLPRSLLQYQKGRPRCQAQFPRQFPGANNPQVPPVVISRAAPVRPDALDPVHHGSCLHAPSPTPQRAPTFSLTPASGLLGFCAPAVFFPLGTDRKLRRLMRTDEESATDV